MSDINCKSVFGSAVVRRTFLAAAGVLLAGSALAEAYVPGAGGIDVRLYQTTAAKGFRELPTAEFTIHPYPAAPAIDVDTAKELHEFDGLGASLTDASAWILAHMEPARRERLLRDLFTPEGCNLAALRLNMGASDYSTALYSYDDTPGDVEMGDFSLKRDDAGLQVRCRMIGSIARREFPSASAALAVVGCRGVSAAVPHLRRLCESNRQENNKQENNKQERNGT